MYMLLKGKRIFIVEDDPQNRVVFQMALMRQGAAVDFERWGTHTVVHLKNTPHIDLIILDLMLPHNISGFDVFDEIRTIPAFEEVPIVAVSAMDATIAMPRAREKGFSGFIPKPIDLNVFSGQIAKIIEGESVWAIT
jgi:CheY-like chemotaxis protein